ncbi:homoisocitrate dehydrogenase [Longilinea arvoryzae]|uniref:Homoisocitrate dehydrogenase n=1 Tax=Longilinea arvoryzae TaxID=360412 RepID=A0A0S7BHZ4_9CHLR|nr:isocitrate/isopropylmalate family dehydrogenase [Longilinea arvoryzae]GAP13162.1 homoisocitrate dehydrogenase [Longilinea arvoryzae]
MPRVCVIPGDGIGQEVIPAAVRVLQAAVPGLETIQAEAGWGCFLERGTAVPPETLAAIRECGAALFGAVSSPAKKVAGYRSAILTLRQELDLYANLRPVRSLPRVSPRGGIDLLVVRENTEGLYVGRERLEDGGETAIAERVITRRASRRLAERALALMHGAGRRRLTIVHKANVLPLTDGLFRDTVREAVVRATRAGQAVEVEELLVDVAALKLASEPERFDVIITTNLFGDILSDEASSWCGGLGLAPSINLGEGVALAEPVHGSAPDIAGQGIANPIAAILSAALLARHAWSMEDSARRIEQAVERALEDGLPHGTEAITRSVTGNLCVGEN